MSLTEWPKLLRLDIHWADSPAYPGGRETHYGPCLSFEPKLEQPPSAENLENLAHRMPSLRVVKFNAHLFHFMCVPGTLNQLIEISGLEELYASLIEKKSNQDMTDKIIEVQHKLSTILDI